MTFLSDAIGDVHSFNAGEMLIIASIAVYILLTAGLAYILRSKSNADYTVGSRSLSPFVIAILMMSEFIGAKSTVGTAQEAFERGMAAAWSVIAASIGFLLLGLFFARQIRRSTQHTISGLVEQRFGSGARLTVSLIMIVALVLVNVGNYLSGGAALNSAVHIGLVPSTLVIAALSALYYVFGGLKSVAYVTIVHSILKIAGIGILVVFAYGLTGGIEPLEQALPESYFTSVGTIGVNTIIAWIVGTVGAIFSTQFIVQAIASNRSEAAARQSALIAALLCLPLGFALAFVGVSARYLYPDMPSLYALPIFIEKMPHTLAAVVAVSMVASVLVGVSTVALATSALVMRDFYVPHFKPDPRHELIATRYVSLAVGLFPLAFVILAPMILKLSFFTRALRLSIAIVALIGVLIPALGSQRTAVWALSLSGVVTSLWYLLGDPFQIDNIFVAAFVPLATFAVSYLFGKATLKNQT